MGDTMGWFKAAIPPYFKKVKTKPGRHHENDDDGSAPKRYHRSRRHRQRSRHLDYGKAQGLVGDPSGIINMGDPGLFDDLKMLAEDFNNNNLNSNNSVLDDDDDPGIQTQEKMTASFLLLFDINNNEDEGHQPWNGGAEVAAEKAEGETNKNSSFLENLVLPQEDGPPNTCMDAIKGGAKTMTDSTNDPAVVVNITTGIYHYCEIPSSSAENAGGIHYQNVALEPPVSPWTVVLFVGCLLLYCATTRSGICSVKRVTETHQQTKKSSTRISFEIPVHTNNSNKDQNTQAFHHMMEDDSDMTTSTTRTSIGSTDDDDENHLALCTTRKPLTSFTALLAQSLFSTAITKPYYRISSKDLQHGGQDRHHPKESEEEEEDQENEWDHHHELVQYCSRAVVLPCDPLEGRRPSASLLAKLIHDLSTQDDRQGKSSTYGRKKRYSHTTTRRESLVLNTLGLPVGFLDDDDDDGGGDDGQYDCPKTPSPRSSFSVMASNILHHNRFFPAMTSAIANAAAATATGSE